MPCQRLAVLFAVFLFVFLPSAVFARDIEIFVEDGELELPLEGAVVSLRNGQQFVCGENGIALVSLPDDRQTIVQISYPGYDPQRLTIPAAAASAGIVRFTASLHLGGVMMGRELVIEAERPDTSETRSGRSVAISERELTRTAEIGIIEDVMSSVKLLPGVGYTGMFGATPSIRGGDPGDLTASFDGFYLERPYHWVGAVSIFDPKMVSSARLSHGVFSSRYGHTISGLLEITSKSPSPTETEMEVAIGSSAASLNLSFPLNGRGGILFMGKVTYWDTLIWAAQGLSRVVEDETLDMINAITTSPYIRSAALAANYRISADTDWRLNFFFGSDGVGAKYKTDYDNPEENIQGRIEMDAIYNNYQGFLVTGLTTSPRPSLALRFTGGVGFIDTKTYDILSNDVIVQYNDDFLGTLPDDIANKLSDKGTYRAPDTSMLIDLQNTIFNAQVRADADWDLGRGFIAAFGVQELYSLWAQKERINLALEVPVAGLPELYKKLLQMQNPGLFPILDLPEDSNAALIRLMVYNGDVFNQGFTTSAYGMVEYATPNRFFEAELGLRLDHLYFLGKDFSAQTMPALNPRLNLDFNVLKNRGLLDSLSVTVGTGLFSSINSLISFMEGSSGIGGFDLKFNRSWTSILGIRLDVADSYSFNIEGYYKRVFDRAYITADITTSDNISPTFLFNGIGNVWGFDLQLQKLESRYWDGWISYSFNWAKYFDPSSGDQGVNMGTTSGDNERWYYPSFHRFHNFNLVLNIKPLQWLNIAVRFGFASGTPRNIVSDTVYSYPVQMVDAEGKPILDENGEPVIIQKYGRDSWPDPNEKERSSWSLPLDVKFSFFLANRKGRANTEIYLAAENLLSLVYRPPGNTRFNDYTGREEAAGIGTSGFDLPIPMVSFGFKWRY
ncbi:MAG: hypothetical protein LBQ69_07165 [Treponema sp.]|jgi:hypothetical protein|nr:hypothetical protein [Treponema sp.]